MHHKVNGIRFLWDDMLGCYIVKVGNRQLDMFAPVEHLKKYAPMMQGEAWLLRNRANLTGILNRG
jgi:hypothetical protein